MLHKGCKIGLVVGQSKDAFLTSFGGATKGDVIQRLHIMKID